ncbi:MAG: SsrA-binding protein SmpB [Planctomycetota bacterium]|nr:SsrA-binding protein SmpB [Planctomycetota bacterium]
MTDKRAVVRNRRAFHDYEIFERLEAGLSLLGPEIKSIREGKVSIGEAYAAFKGGELFLFDMHIPEYAHRGYAPHEPRRPRKCLMHKRELKKLESGVARRGLTLVPIQLYFVRGRLKVELGVAKGRKRHDKREAVRDKEARREAKAAEGKRRR